MFFYKSNKICNIFKTPTNWIKNIYINKKNCILKNPAYLNYKRFPIYNNVVVFTPIPYGHHLNNNIMKARFSNAFYITFFLIIAGKKIVKVYCFVVIVLLWLLKDYINNLESKQEK